MSAGVSQGGPTAIAFAAEHPARTRGLALYGTYAKAGRADDYPVGATPETVARFAELAAAHWGTDALLPLFAPSREEDRAFAAWWRRSSRAALSPAGVRTMLTRRAGLDVRPLLPAVQAPTVVLHRTGDRVNPIEHGRFLAAHIPRARLVELDGDDHLWWLPEPAQVAEPVLELVSRTWPTRARGGRRSPSAVAPQRGRSAR